MALTRHLTDGEIDRLRRGGHDLRKVYAAYARAVATRGRPTVILAMTKKGYGMGRAGESRMTAHQEKKLDVQALRAFRDRFSLPLSDAQVEALEFLHPGDASDEVRYLRNRRAALGGALPARCTTSDVSIPVPSVERSAEFALRADGKAMSTTMAAVRQLTQWLRDRELGPALVPIVADEARTFGMATLFRQIGIYAPEGQRYVPEDAGSLLSYREATDGQLLEEGITEAGALASWIAAGTAYAVHGRPLLPVYIFYSMFGFQRVGDLIWAAADQRARGILLGATSGRTTLAGEGLQHQDGSSHLIAATVPTCRAYDPCYAHELAVILDRAARDAVEDPRDVFYYVTVMNESYAQPTEPTGCREGILRGMYRLGGNGPDTAAVRLLGSGAILREIQRASEMLAADWGVSSEVWSVTSYSELAREARTRERLRRYGHATEESWVVECLRGERPVVAASDYVSAYAGLIAPFIEAPVTTLGTDGLGRSDTRARLRSFFEVDATAIVMAALRAVHGPSSQSMEAAVRRYGLSFDETPPWDR